MLLGAIDTERTDIMSVKQMYFQQKAPFRKEENYQTHKTRRQIGVRSLARYLFLWGKGNIYFFVRSLARCLSLCKVSIYFFVHSLARYLFFVQS